MPAATVVSFLVHLDWQSRLAILMDMTNKQGSHFWMMVIQQRGGVVGSYQGTTTPERGETRLDLFNRVRTEIGRDYPDSVNGAVIDFDVQPNKL